MFAGPQFDRTGPALSTDRLRFGFGANWERFARTIDDPQIESARRSLGEMLGDSVVSGGSFLDVGSGSGLFSLAAILLGAERVYSFDFDADSVRTTRSLRERHAPSSAWTITRGSVLDEEFMRRAGAFNVVYSWGVLHHTGDLWRALDLTVQAVAPGGWLFVSIYNDQGRASRRWRAIKRRYNQLPAYMRAAYAILVMLPLELRALAGCCLRREPKAYLRAWTGYDGRPRGMSRWHDLIDWVGGYPFEVASPDAVFEFCSERGLKLTRMTTCGGGPGCNQFVFRREPEPNRSNTDGAPTNT
jgi:2-polyprenyl-6-hydroxyphenyl methylase/3-demethylubiquinone-9 3-methyltransferase